MLYGLMTEEINYSYDGGLYAEMVRNRTPQEGRGGGTHAGSSTTRAPPAPPSPSTTMRAPAPLLPGSLLFDIKSADAQNPAGFRNEGYWGMAVRPDTTYKGSLYAKADADSFGPLTASLINDNTGETLATATIGNASTSWKQYELHAQDRQAHTILAPIISSSPQVTPASSGSRSSRSFRRPTRTARTATAPTSWS